MAAQVKVIRKEAEIDGKPIKWQVLSIIGYLGGDFQEMEIKLDKNQAMLAGMLLASDEKPPVTEARKATEDEQEDFFKQNHGNSDKIVLEDE